MAVQTKFVVALMVFDQALVQDGQIRLVCTHILADTNREKETYLQARDRLINESWQKEIASSVLARKPRLIFVNEDPDVLRLIYGVSLPGARKLVAYKPAVSLANLPGMKKEFFDWAYVNARTELVI